MVREPSPLFDAHYHFSTREPAYQPGVVNSTHQGMWPEALASFQAGYAGVMVSLGIHPWFINPVHLDRDLSELEALLQAYPGLMVGETGLDRIRGPGQDIQIRAFREQLVLARDLNRVVSIHCVQAWGRLAEILEELRPGRAIIHSVQCSPELVRRLSRTGAYLSFGYASARPGTKAEAALQACPEDRLLLETDGPYPEGFLPPDGGGRTLPDPVSHGEAIEAWYTLGERLLASLRGAPRGAPTWKERILRNAQIFTHGKTPGHPGTETPG